jgi:hypothetical protein
MGSLRASSTCSKLQLLRDAPPHRCNVLKPAVLCFQGRALCLNRCELQETADGVVITATPSLVDGLTTQHRHSSATRCQVMYEHETTQLRTLLAER